MYLTIQRPAFEKFHIFTQPYMSCYPTKVFADTSERTPR